MDPVIRVFLSASTDEMSMNGAQSQRQLVKQTVMILNRRVNMNNTFKRCWQPAGGSQTCAAMIFFF